jgi:WD40 repeat protein
MWCAETGELLGQASVQGGCVVSVGFSPDGQHLAGGHLSGVTVIWDVRSWEEITRLDSSPDDVDGLAFSPDGRHLATQSLRWVVRLWDLQSGECVRRIGGTADALAVAAGWPRFPWLAIGHRWETSIEPARHRGPPVAWLAGTLHRLTSHPSGRLWAATHGRYVEVFALEGD